MKPGTWPLSRLLWGLACCGGFRCATCGSLGVKPSWCIPHVGVAKPTFTVKSALPSSNDNFLHHQSREQRNRQSHSARNSWKTAIKDYQHHLIALASYLLRIPTTIWQIVRLALMSVVGFRAWMPVASISHISGISKTYHDGVNANETGSVLPDRAIVSYLHNVPTSNQQIAETMWPNPTFCVLRRPPFSCLDSQKMSQLLQAASKHHLIIRMQRLCRTQCRIVAKRIQDEPITIVDTLFCVMFLLLAACQRPVCVLFYRHSRSYLLVLLLVFTRALCRKRLSKKAQIEEHRL